MMKGEFVYYRLGGESWKARKNSTYVLNIWGTAKKHPQTPVYVVVDAPKDSSGCDQLMDEERRLFSSVKLEIPDNVRFISTYDHYWLHVVEPCTDRLELAKKKLDALREEKITTTKQGVALRSSGYEMSYLTRLHRWLLSRADVIDDTRSSG